jgi:hypothetical protein
MLDAGSLVMTMRRKWGTLRRSAQQRWLHICSFLTLEYLCVVILLFKNLLVCYHNADDKVYRSTNCLWMIYRSLCDRLDPYPHAIVDASWYYPWLLRGSKMLTNFCASCDKCSALFVVPKYPTY